jgi:hypothetical protein
MHMNWRSPWLVLLIVTSAVATAEEVPYGVGDWPEVLGNHRAKIRVDQKADAVWVHLPWRRRDAAPEKKEIIVIDAATNQRVQNVLRVNVTRQSGDLLIQPVTVPGEYFVYYLPYKTEGSWYFPTTVYLPAIDSAKPDWAAACGPIADQVRQGKTAELPVAQVLEFQAINEFHRFDPMEVVASPEETKTLLAANPDRAYLVFPEDRKFPIRMTDELPLCWTQRGPIDTFAGDACRGEFYAFQLGVYAARQAVEAISAEVSDLKSDAGAAIPAASIRCFNLAGADWLGRPIHKTVSVPQGKIQALWFGVDVPRTLPAGTYRGTVTLRGQKAPATAVRLTLNVSDKLLEDRGDSELWRHSRLRWLDSTIGLDDEVFAPYTPVKAEGRTISVLGRSVQLADSGLFSGITTTFTRNVDAADAPPQEILAEPMRLVVEPAAGPLPRWKSAAGPKVVAQASGSVTWESVGTAGPMTLVCRGKLECDGYVNFRLTLKAAQAGDLKDVRLELPLRREIATYMMGMGRKGGYRPKHWEWKWDVDRSNNQLWIGDVNAGLSCKLKHVEDRWDLFNVQESGLYKDWGNGGRGGCTVEETGSEVVLIRAYTGPRSVAAGEELHFNFGLLITPVKVLDRDHWQWRYFHSGGVAPAAEVADAGAKVINLHQGNGHNPYINYPFLTTDKLSAYAADAHARQMRVKIYYTIRELTNYTAEFWALRSLGEEIFRTGPGFQLADQFAEHKETPRQGPTGSSWLCEHAINGYVPAWHQHLGNGHYDAAIATTGLSRWHNYYLEGLNWLVRNVGIDGLYLDGIGYDREIMKRVRKVLQRARPGCLIDFHSGSHFAPQYGMNNCANLYIELFPCIDSLWFGEGFNYDETPDFWMVEVAGIPYGLFGEMLGGGNPWRGMVYGMSNRLGWGGDPRHLWKLWDEFGIRDARMIGYWDSTCPVKTGRDDVLATVYQRDGRSLIALASWAPGPSDVRLTIDFARLGLDPAKANLYSPPLPGFQGEFAFKPDEPIRVAPGRGWLLVLDEKTRQLPPPVDITAGRKTLLEATFPGNSLDKEWTVTLSKRPNTALRAADGVLRIEAAANAAAFAERSIPAGATLVVSRIDQQTDGGASWGPGLTLVWPNGKVLRVNLRAEGRFGVDDGQRQFLEGVSCPGVWTQLALRLDEKEIVALASQDGRLWQELARLPRGEFPGDPSRVRLGKMSPGSKAEDHGILGPAGVCAIKDLHVLGK